MSETYKPRYLSWCKSKEEEIEEFKRLIEGNPSDVELLIEELDNLTRGE